MQAYQFATTLVAASVLLTSISASAQLDHRSSRFENPDRSRDMERDQDKFASRTQATQSCRASDILGKTVKNEQGETLGKVNDLIVNLASGQTPFAIISYGGALGLGATEILVPIEELRRSSRADELLLSTSKRAFENASKLPTGAWAAAVHNEAWSRDIDAFYSQPSQHWLNARQPAEGKQDVGAYFDPRREDDTDARGDDREYTRSRDWDRQNQRDPQTPVREAREVTKGDGAKVLLQLEDRQLKQKIETMIHSDPRTTATSSVQVDVQHGVVRLSGQAAARSDVENLERRIRALHGVQRVENDVIVQSW